MDDSAYLTIMMRYHKEGFRFAHFFRPIWFFAMFVLLAGAIFFLLEEYLRLNAFGWLIVGFLLANILISVRLYFRTLRTWPIYDKYMNWDLIESQLDMDTK